MTEYRRRLIDDLIERLLPELPALFIVGPRATGKTTTAARYAKTVVRLDREAEAVAFRADPDSALRGLPEPVLFDEWQLVPGVLGAIKRAVDAGPTPGRFLVTGSVRGDLEGELWPGTGRLTRVPLFGMSIREQLGNVGASPFSTGSPGERNCCRLRTRRTSAATLTCFSAAGSRARSDVDGRCP